MNADENKQPEALGPPAAGLPSLVMRHTLRLCDMIQVIEFRKELNDPSL